MLTSPSFHEDYQEHALNFVSQMQDKHTSDRSVG